MAMDVIDLSDRPRLSCPSCDAPFTEIVVTDTPDSDKCHVSIRHAGKGCPWWKTDEAPTWVRLMLYRIIDKEPPV